MARGRPAARPVHDRRSARSRVLAVLLSLAAVLVGILATSAPAGAASSGPVAHHIVLSLPDTSPATDSVTRDLGEEATRDARRGPPPHVARDVSGERHATHLGHAVPPTGMDPRPARAGQWVVASPVDSADHRRYARRPPGRAPPSPQDI